MARALLTIVRSEERHVIDLDTESSIPALDGRLP
jgi:hypothetical protein